MNNKKVEKLIREILIEIGENPDREGLLDTPRRVANMYKEIYRGYDESQKPKITTFNNGADGLTYNEMIIDEGSFYSQCEHHICNFFGKYYFAYIPSKKGKILGLSKVARIVDFYSAKLQIQERLVKDIVECIWTELSKDGCKPMGMALIMEGEHLCKTMRGVKKKGLMRCSYMKGNFKDNIETRGEFLKLIK